MVVENLRICDTPSLWHNFNSVFTVILWAGYLSHYSDWLRAGRSGNRIAVGRVFPPVQTGPGANPASCRMGTGSFPGVKYGRGVLLTTHTLLVPLSWKSRAIPLPTLWATTGPVTGPLYLFFIYYLLIIRCRQGTECNRRNGPDFGRVFLMLNYTEKPQNTYIQSSMVTEIQAREKCGLLWCLCNVLYLWRHTRRIWGMGPVYYNFIPTLSLEAAERPWLS